MPGTNMALEHEDIMQNMERFRVELEHRRRGASIDIPILLVIDELNGLLMNKSIKKELTELIELFAQQARGYNMYMILCAQRTSGLAAIRNSVIGYICHKCPEMESSKILPSRYAKLTPELGVGQTFVCDADGQIEPLQQTLILPEDMQRPSRQRTATTSSVPQRPTPPQQDVISPQKDRMALRRSRLAAQLSSTPTASTVPKPTKNLQQKTSPSATWDEELGSEKLILPSIPKNQPIRQQRLRDTDELVDHQALAPQPDDITQPNQVSNAQQKLDRLAEIRATRRKKK
jgi:hypothetical protein